MSIILIKNITGIMGLLLLIITVLFLFMPSQLRRLNNVSKTWFSVRKFLKKIEELRDVDEQIISNAKVVGVVSLILTVIFVYLYVKL